MYARIVEGRVQAVGETGAELIDGGCTHVVDVGDTGAQPGWAWTPEGCTPPQRPSQADAIRAELAALDAYVPRSVEEIYAADAIKGLAEINVQRIARKVELRAQLAALEA